MPDLTNDTKNALCPGSGQTLILSIIQDLAVWCTKCGEIVEVEYTDETAYISNHVMARSLTNEERLTSENAHLKQLLAEVLADPTVALSYAIVHRDLSWDDNDIQQGTGEVTHIEPEGRWRSEARAALLGESYGAADA